MKNNIQQVIDFIKAKPILNYLEVEAILKKLQEPDIIPEKNADQKPTKKSS